MNGYATLVTKDGEPVGTRVPVQMTATVRANDLLIAFDPPSFEFSPPTVVVAGVGIFDEDDTLLCRFGFENYYEEEGVRLDTANTVLFRS